jgi:hypothetical protein
MLNPQIGSLAFRHTHCTLEKNVIFNVQKGPIQISICFKLVFGLLVPEPLSKVAFRPTLDGVQDQNSEEPIWTNLKQTESLNWTMPWTLACILVLQIMSSPFRSLKNKSEPIDFPSKMVQCRSSQICHFLDLHLKVMAPIYGSEPIGLLYFNGPWILDLHVKWL